MVIFELIILAPEESFPVIVLIVRFVHRIPFPSFSAINDLIFIEIYAIIQVVTVEYLSAIAAEFHSKDVMFPMARGVFHGQFSIAEGEDLVGSALFFTGRLAQGIAWFSAEL